MLPALQYRQINYSDIVRVVTPGSPLSFQGFRVPPGARAFCRALPFNAGVVFVAKFSRPRTGAGLASGGAFVLRQTDEMPMELDSELLSQWFVDADTALDGVQVWVVMNAEGRAQ